MGAVVAGGGMAAAAVAMAGTSGRGGSSAAGPVKTHVHSLPLTGSSASLKTLGARSTDPFSMVGVIWRGAHASLRGTVEVRTRSAADSHWTAWLKMQQPDDIPNPAEPNRPGVRGGMSPIWAGPSNGIQVRAAGAHRTAALPAGLLVDLIDPGKADTSTGGTTGTGMAPAGNTAGASVSRTPSIIQETSTTRTGTWTHKSGTGYLGGYSYSSSATGASISWTFTGRSVAWIVS
ncbi:hypothetical protein AB5L52_36555 [Streptomyces sp. CG4]|uniref:hypothetical protein n=1 Tax=Streptomyces sp. CG4 TaxID=408783 RepID=UPI0034E2C5F4